MTGETTGIRGEAAELARQRAEPVPRITRGTEDDQR